MFQHLVSFLCLCALTSSVHAGDAVSTWLQHMGCNQLLAAYYEEQLEHGDQKTKVVAATELANLYAVLLSRASDGSDDATLKRASALLEKIPSSGTIDLRIQLLRATYLSCEQMLEKYRLRFVNTEQADVAVIQLEEIETSLERLRESFLRKTRSSRSSNDQLARRLGTVTSLLGWTKYYIAWHLDLPQKAREAAVVFATIIRGEQPSLQQVSLDLKTYDYGARAILGIALCKDVMDDPAGPNPWLEELEDPQCWTSVRMQIPMWKFFLDIDHMRWDIVLSRMHSVDDMDQTLILRIATVHALEDPGNASAQEVATNAITALVQIGQLGMVSEIVDIYGFDALHPRGFITKYIQGDLAYRKLRLDLRDDEPTVDPEVVNRFLKIATTFKEAIHAFDVLKYQQLLDDCNYMLGLSLFHASAFRDASSAFLDASTGDAAERAIWMAIVSLDHLEITSETNALKERIVQRYISSWPNSPRATKLLLHQSQVATVSKDRVDDLLAVPQSDPQYTDAQEQASRLLYKAWQSVTPSERSKIGNQYVFTAIPLLLVENDLADGDVSPERVAVRAFRILEVSLHSEIKRIIAAENAFKVLLELQETGRYDTTSQASELAYRKVQAALISNDDEALINEMNSMIGRFPNDDWTIRAAKSVWASWERSQQTVPDELRFQIGIQFIGSMSDADIVSLQFAGVARTIAETGTRLYTQTANKAIGEQALRIARLLIVAFPQNASLLRLNSLIETNIGNKDIALQHWRTLAAGSKRGGLDWLEAKFHIISSLAKNKPKEALAILDQHHALYPSYGSDPYGSQLKQLHLELEGVRDES